MSRLLQLAGDPHFSLDVSLLRSLHSAYGPRLRRSSYERATGVEGRPATGDLAELVSAGLLTAEGEKRGRKYRGSEPLGRLRCEAQGARQSVVDPYFDCRGWLAQQRAALADGRPATQQLELTNEAP